jgi:hypothetical protein
LHALIEIILSALFKKRGEQTMIDQPTNARLRELASRIAEERDHATFSKLIAEFNQLLEGSAKSSGEPARPKTQDLT